MRILLRVALFAALAAACDNANMKNKAGQTGGANLSSLTDKRWKLVELMGKPIADYGDLNAEPFIQFVSKDNRVTASGGCNNMSGAFELASAGRIRIGPMMSTKMACPNMSVETEMGRLLETVDNYAIADGKLSLHRARMAPLMRFEAAE